MAYEFVLAEAEGPLGIVTINRPKVLNALNHQVIDEVVTALEGLDRDPAVRCLILTGSERAFAAGADIGQMAEAGPIEVLADDNFARWARLRGLQKPLIAAVSGYALGGGCELALMCDLIVASETAQFGQPEINIGIMPGAGGTQRLARAIGPYRAMELILTGRTLDAHEAYAAGLVNRVMPVGGFLAEAQRLAAEIAERAPIAVRLAREAIRYGVETTVRDGLEIERRNFYLLFDTEDQKEGMPASL